mmetsp:Transcript_2245/g.4588  ORF Transcript_2245/g.4588 Transcript_2245/m.4588 type:complete len:234 (-) Transcript_2245:620-1321(-)
MAADSPVPTASSNAPAAARRRRNKASGSTADASTNSQLQQQQPKAQPIDENEQRDVVQKLRAETIRITNDLCNVVVTACLGAGVLTVVTPLLIAYVDKISAVNGDISGEVEDGTSGTSALNIPYTILSLAGHIVMAYIGQRAKIPTGWTPSFPIRTAKTHRGMHILAVILLVMELVFVLYLNQYSAAIDPISVGQFTGNVCTLLAAFFVAMDSIASEDVMRKHDGSRYSFKTL